MKSTYYPIELTLNFEMFRVRVVQFAYTLQSRFSSSEVNSNL